MLREPPPPPNNCPRFVLSLVGEGRLVDKIRFLLCVWLGFYLEYLSVWCVFHVLEESKMRGGCIPAWGLGVQRMAVTARFDLLVRKQ